MQLATTATEEGALLMRQTPTHTAILPNLPPDLLLKTALPLPLVPPSVANFPAGLAHDARSVLAAMDIYCELLSGPGVLNPEYRHLVDELRLLRESSSGLMDRLILQAIRAPSRASSPVPSEDALEQAYGGEHPEAALARSPDARTRASDQPGARKLVTSVAAELVTSHKMLAALAGPKVQLDISTSEAPDGELCIATVDFTRVLINLVRNAAEAMGTGGRIVIAAGRAPADSVVGPAILVSVEDNGPGIPLSLLERIFDLTTVSEAGEEHTRRRMSFRPRGLGLRIVRELVEGGGGLIRAARLPERGSRFEIVLPMVTK